MEEKRSMAFLEKLFILLLIANNCFNIKVDQICGLSDQVCGHNNNQLGGGEKSK